MKQITFKHWSKRKCRSEWLGSLISNFQLNSFHLNRCPSLSLCFLDSLLFIYTHNIHHTIHQTISNCHEIFEISNLRDLRQKGRRNAKVREGELVEKNSEDKLELSLHENTHTTGFQVQFFKRSQEAEGEKAS